MIGKQFAVWIAIAATGFAAAVIALDAMDAPTVVVFLSGIVFVWVTDPIMEWLQDWREAETQTENRENNDNPTNNPDP